MSNLNPGGNRRVGGRVFNPVAIDRVCNSKGLPGVDKPSNSQADQPHARTREQERYARQQAAKAAKGHK